MDNMKKWQFSVMLKTNPARDKTSTWIRSVENIHTFKETLDDSDWEGWEEGCFDPDYNGADVKKALDCGMITV